MEYYLLKQIEKKNIKRDEEMSEEEKKGLVLSDPPSCEFLDENIKDEELAIKTYMAESDRTNDPVLKETFHKLAQDEMNHLHLLESIKKKLSCKKE